MKILRFCWSNSLLPVVHSSQTCSSMQAEKVQHSSQWTRDVLPHLGRGSYPTPMKSRIFYQHTRLMCEHVSCSTIHHTCLSHCLSAEGTKDNIKQLVSQCSLVLQGSSRVTNFTRFTSFTVYQGFTIYGK